MMDFSGKKVLVTGAGGFIGSHLVERLVTAGAHVRAFLRYNSQSNAGWLEESPRETKSRVEVFWGDLRDGDAVRNAVQGMDLVFHLGALIAIPYSYQNPADFFQTNVLGTLYIATACRDFAVERLVHTSTSEVYGTAQSVPMTEEHPLVGQSPYSASKIGADQVVESFIRSFDLPAVILRPFNTYGPRQSERAVIPTIVQQALFSASIRLGTLDSTRDFVYVSDSVEAFLHAASEPSLNGQTVHFGTGEETTIGQLVEIIRGIAGRDLQVVPEDIRRRPEKSEVDRLVCDASRFRSSCGWRPEVAIAEGLRRVYAFYEERPKPKGDRRFVV